MRNRKICAKFGFKMSNIIYAAFLTMLSERPLYGYLLVDNLREFGIKSSYVPYGAAYRILRKMEAQGLVSSEWKTEGSGPARRVYHITPQGKDFLKRWLSDAKENYATIEKILKKVSEVTDEQDK